MWLYSSGHTETRTSYIVRGGFDASVGIGSGLALGREGPTVQIGSAVGAAVAQGLRVSPRQRQTLIAAGAGAGLAAAFNAPLAGLAFVLEELQRHFAPAVFGATFVATVTANVLTRSLTSQLPLFHVSLAPAPPLVALPVFLSLGQLAPLVLPGAGVRPETFVVVGMAAYFAAIVRAPLTGIVLIVEMTNSYDQMLPLLVACFAVYAVADFLMDRPIYEALLERDLAHDTELPRLERPIILEFTVHKGARVAGKKVHEVALPEGCVLHPASGSLGSHPHRRHVPGSRRSPHGGDYSTGR
jgi:H+/Cl- antiporter ClcA